MHVEDDRVVYAQAEADGQDDQSQLVRRWNIPTLNCSAIILGQGSSVSQGAMRRFHDDGVMVAFAGTDGTPFLMASQSYRPGRRLQYWANSWHDPAWRLRASKIIHSHRTSAVEAAWSAYSQEGWFMADPSGVIRKYREGISLSQDVGQLMGYEGGFSKGLYKLASASQELRWDGRQPGMGLDRLNRNLDHANYLAYGIAAIALWAYGIPFSMAVTHGAGRAGGLVFDMADSFKDAILLPTCAAYAARGSDLGLRQALTERLHGAGFLDKANGTIGYAFKVLDSLLPGGLEESDVDLMLPPPALMIEQTKVLTTSMPEKAYHT